jgi:ABC-2 type transport system ATP-binding protein
VTTDETALRIDGAAKTYRGFLGRREREAVRGVSMEVGRGSVHGLLGPNGAGKTTTIKMLLGLVHPDDGLFEVGGRNTQRASGRTDIGFLPEQPYFPAHLRARRALAMYGRLSGVRGDLAREIDELLASVGLDRHADEALSKFSRGMLQRFGIVQALIGAPTLVVLDEPASGLDPVGQRDVRNLILSMRERGITVLLSSHQLSEVEAVCDRVTIMHAGRIAAEGSLDSLLNTEGLTSVRAILPDGMPPELEGATEDVAVSEGMWVFSIPDPQVRRAIDVIDDSGGRVVRLGPKRESLEEYFDRMLRSASDGGP